MASESICSDEYGRAESFKSVALMPQFDCFAVSPGIGVCIFLIAAVPAGFHFAPVCGQNCLSILHFRCNCIVVFPFLDFS